MGSRSIHTKLISKLLDIAPKKRRSKILYRLLKRYGREFRGEITAAIIAATGYTVQDGPFKGMLLPTGASWETDGDLAPKVLGSYEAELHKCVLELAKKDYSTIVNIGCAEGYYAVGMARLIPQATVYAFDISETAQRMCKVSAEANKVEDRVIVHGTCTTQVLSELFKGKLKRERVLMIVDCEGAELDLLRPDEIPSLLDYDVLVEVHDFVDPMIAQVLCRRFSASHEVEQIMEGPRDPNQYPILRKMGSLERWLAVCEFRPETMHWLMLRSRLHPQ